MLSVIDTLSLQKYMYYDGFHPTETAFKVIAGKAYKAQARVDEIPYHISILVMN